jgi:hypothetical protein
MVTTEDTQPKHLILSGPFDYPSQALHIQLQNVQMASFTMYKQKLSLL